MTDNPTVMLVLVGLAALGVLFGITASRRAAKKAAKGVREVNRLTAMAFRTVLFAGVITGVQWLVTHYATDPRVIVPTLAVPALIGAFQLARMFAVTEVVYSRRGGSHR
ncbi:MAG: hypothetical protein ACRDSK_05620 [Actinophytocola sp.]|uniref:hypothetical protein n=1 Tax=Actinophytocola sp. TaxID=1872138 RepID=UPI003D6A431B